MPTGKETLAFLISAALLAAPVLPVKATNSPAEDLRELALAAEDALESLDKWQAMVTYGESCCVLRREDRPRFLEELTRYADALGRVEKAFTGSAASSLSDPAVGKARIDLAKEVVAADRSSLFTSHVLTRIVKRQSAVRPVLQVCRESVQAMEADLQKKDLERLRGVEEITAEKMERLKQKLLEQ